MSHVRSITPATGLNYPIKLTPTVKPGSPARPHAPVRSFPPPDIRPPDMAPHQEHLRELFERELGEARAQMDARVSKQNAADKQLFDALIEPIINGIRIELIKMDKKSEITDYVRHYAFMINEASKVEGAGDYLTAAAIMLHDIKTDQEASGLPKNKFKLKESLLNQLRIKNPLKQSLNEALAIRRRFLNLSGILYRPPKGKHRNLIQNFLNGLICASEGDGRALLMRVIHRYSSHALSRVNEAKWSRSTHHIFGPQAARFGLIDLSKRTHDIAFRLGDPGRHAKLEREILETLEFDSRDEAEDYLDRIRQKLEVEADRKGFAVSSQNVRRSRIKDPWSVKNKLENKPDLYPEVSLILDLNGVYCLTEKPIFSSVSNRDTEAGLKKAVEIAQAAAGERFRGIVWSHRGQPETRVRRISSHGREMIYLDVTLKVATETGGERAIEIKFMDEEAYKAYIDEIKPHWVYDLAKLPEVEGQKFDEEELRACGELMTGNFLEDVKAIYAYLNSKWVYVYYHVRDPKSTEAEPTTWVKRRKKGSISPDAAYPFSKRAFGGIMVSKIWDNKHKANRAPDLRPLETGDLIEICGGSDLIRGKELLALAGRAKHLAAKYHLYLQSEVEPNIDLEQAERVGETILQAELRKRRRRFDRRALERVASKQEMEPAQLLAMLAFKQANFISAREIAEQMYES